MYLWKIKNLKEEIKQDSISKRDYLLYVLLFTLLYTALFIQALIQIDSLWNIEMVVIQIVISVIGITYVYTKNGGAKGKDFVQRFTSVGLVFVLRSLFFMSLGMLNLYVMTHLFGVAELFSTKNAIIIGMIFELLLYWRIGSHIESLKT